MPEFGDVTLGDHCVFLLDEQFAVLPDLLDNPALVPLLQKMLHVHVGGEETEDAIRDYLGQSYQEVAIVS